MLEVILSLLVILWILGFIHIPWLSIPQMSLFEFNHHPITLRNVLIFILILWVISVLSKPLKGVAAVLLVLWLLSALGIIAIAGFGQMIILAVIIGLLLFIFGVIH
jgi:hypothetical protein